MEYKKIDKKIDFLKISKEEQEKLLKEAVKRGQEEQRKLEKKYTETVLKGVCV
jgi:hypothetical protein